MYSCPHITDGIIEPEAFWELSREHRTGLALLQRSRWATTVRGKLCDTGSGSQIPEYKSHQARAQQTKSSQILPSSFAFSVKEAVSEGMEVN